MQDETGKGQIAGSTVSLIVRLVRRLAGEDAVARVLELAGEERSLAEIEDPAVWSSYDAAIRLFTAAAEVTGEPRLGLLVGEETLLQYRHTEVAALLRSLGSPGEVLRNVAESATKFSTATLLEALEVGDERAVVAAWAIEGLVRHPMMCDLTAGVLSQAPVLFAMDPAEVVEKTCQGRGDDRCVYEVRWDASSSPEADPTRRIAYLEEQVATLTERFESLQATATELVAAAGVGEVVRAIVDRARLAVRATQYVLAVCLSPGEPIRVEHRGFGDAEPPPALVAELLAESPDTRQGSRLIVDVGTTRRRFGRLVAMCPEGSQFLPGEGRLLKAYAANAAVALEARAALDEAHRRHDTARALLGLSSALAEVAQPEEVSQRIAEAVPHVVGGERAGVLLWDDDTQRLVFAGLTGLPADTAETLRSISVAPSDTPALGAMLDERQPLFIDATTDDAFLAALLEISGADAAVAVPIVAGDRMLGVIAAELPPAERSGDNADLLERLSGLSAQAATALENGRLLAQVVEQSLHDPLSGLPNRTLLRDRIERALARGARTGDWPVLLFMDLDHFKKINDTFGHAAGDDVVASLAARLRGAVRKVDTVARLGGDEFAVLLEDMAAAPAALEKVISLLLEAVREPLVAGGNTIRLSVSIGAAAASGDDDHDSLLRRADAAMYMAKDRGRDAAVLA